MFKKENASRSQILLPDLIMAAKEQNWKLVDKTIPVICENEGFLAWAEEDGVNDQNENVRDLAVSIWERSKHELEPTLEIKLRGLMARDGNRYVQFRASFVLFAHNFRDPEVILKLQEAQLDHDVKEIASSYLSRLK